MVNGINNGVNAAALQEQNRTQQKSQEKVSKTEQVNRVEEIKQQIEAGTYKVDVEKTAKAMADILI